MNRRIAYNGRIVIGDDQPTLIQDDAHGDADIRSQLIDLLRETGTAHHRAYFAANGDDADWPLWYAEYSQPRLNSLLGAHLTRSELTYWLVLVEKERMVAAAPAAWPEYYADFFLERYGAMARPMPEAPRM